MVSLDWLERSSKLDKEAEPVDAADTCGTSSRSIGSRNWSDCCRIAFELLCLGTGVLAAGGVGEGDKREVCETTRGRQCTARCARTELQSPFDNR
eukprot:39687-Pleurochrysis_carterae.AAC.2